VIEDNFNSSAGFGETDVMDNFMNLI
jgi:hypothetical protein